MNTIVSIAFSEDTNSFNAGYEVGESVLSKAEHKRYSFAFLFSSAKHDSSEVFSGVRKVLNPNTKIIGGSTPGIITNDYFGYGNHHVGLALLSSDEDIFSTYIESGLNRSEFESGSSLGEQINENESNIDSMLVFYDSVKQSAKLGSPAMNLATPLINGIKSKISPLPVFAGCGTLADAFFDYPSIQYYNDKIYEQCVMALVLNNSLQMDTIILHGTKPASGYHTITKSEGNIIYEIDNKPALVLISEILGEDSGLQWEDFPLFLTLGLNKGDKFGDYNEDNYANRLCLAIIRELKAIVMFEPDIIPGMEIQIMRRSFDFNYIGERVIDIFKKIEGRKPVLAFYINCLGRCSAYSGLEKEDVEELQKFIPKELPLFGIYSGVEIAKVGNDVQALDWTGVLCILSEK